MINLPGIFVAVLLVHQIGRTASLTKVVVDLTDQDFEESLLDYEHALVLFYSDSCVHCQNFMPEFESAADELIRNEPPVHSARVNCLQAGAETCRQQDIDGLPALKVFKRATLYDEYEGARSAPELISYMRNLVGITSHELNADGALSFAADLKDVTVIAFLRPSGHLRDSYFGLPPHLSKEIRFAHYNIEAEDAGIQNRIKLIHPEYMRSIFEPNEYIYDGDGFDLLEFILKHRYGLVGLRKPRNVDAFGTPLVLAYFDIDLVHKRKMFSYWRNRILKVAVNYTSHFNFAVASFHEFQSEFHKFGIERPKDVETPTVFAILQDNTKYLLSKPFSVQNFEEFLDALINGTADPHLKSQPIPDPALRPEGQFVVDAVAANFKHVVVESSQDILLEFYAPWCTYCKELAGVLNELAKIMDGENMKIVQFDATANEIPTDFEIAGYPTLYWLPANDKDAPEIYNGGRKLDELVKFIAAHATHELTKFNRKGRIRKRENEAEKNEL